MTQAITQAAIKATKAAIISAGEVEKHVKNPMTSHQKPRVSSLISNQPTFKCKAPYKYHDLSNF